MSRNSVILIFNCVSNRKADAESLVFYGNDAFAAEGGASAAPICGSAHAVGHRSKVVSFPLERASSKQKKDIF
jgi:hypothetical protein